MRGGVAVLGLALIAGACSQPVAVASPSADRFIASPAVAAATPSPTPWPTVPPDDVEPPLPAGATGEIADAIHTRWQFGLRSDLEWVEAVAADPDDWSMLEIPMTPEENREFSAWSEETNRLVEILGAYGRARPDEFGGIFVDQRGRRVATLWTGDLEGHEARLRERAGQDAPIVVYPVQHPESYLRQLQDRVPLDDEFYAAANAKPTGVGVDIKANTVSIDISSADPAAPGLVRSKVAQFLGVPESIVSVESDGTGIELLPFGQIEIHVVGPDGHRVPKDARLDWRYEGDQIGTCGPGGDMWIGFDDRGVLRTPCNPGTWRIVVTNDDRTRDLGSGTAVIRANELTTITITLDRNP
jgi:hypothetical protein